MHVSCHDCVEFREEILLRGGGGGGGGECKTQENSNFLRNGKIIICVKKSEIFLDLE